MDEDTDLLEPIAGPSTVTFTPVDLVHDSFQDVTPDTIASSLAPLADLEAVQTCVQVLITRDISRVELVRTILDIGISRARPTADRIEADVRKQLEDKDWAELDRPQVDQALDLVLGSDDAARGILQRYSQLLHLQKRLDTFEAIAPSPPQPVPAPAPAQEEQQDVQIDDPWAEAEAEPDLGDHWETGSTKSAVSERSTASAAPAFPTSQLPFVEPPIPLSTFLSEPLPDTTSTLLSNGAVSAVEAVYTRHTNEIWPYRFDVLETLPPWTSPTTISSSGLLPAAGAHGQERPPPSSATTFFDLLPLDFSLSQSSLVPTSVRSVEDLKDWYTSRVEVLDAFGLLDIQLDWIKQALTLDVQGLDELSEDLLLLSRLVYDAHLSPEQQANWTFASWRAASPDTVIKAYLANATAEGIVTDIRRLVFPYLYVLESRAERAGKPYAKLVETHLHNVVLDLPLNLALPIFDASKATVPHAERFIKDDLTVARLALACLYGSNNRDSWSTMSSIFECLPVWDVSGGDPDDDKEATATTLDSIASFVRPTRAGAHSPTARDLFIFFAPLPFASLSRALDILDVHLESGEILARWNTPVQLRFLLQSAREKGDQLELAEKMVRRQVMGTHTDKRWNALWEDMKRLSGGEDAMLRGAFGVLTVDEMMRIYIGGALASGRFVIARRVIQRLDMEQGIPEGMLEKAVLQASREFYENAESGNLHTGDMKLAYDCLEVAPPSDAITKERGFIEATSRLATFSLRSPSGSGTLSPLEILHAKNKLDLVRQVLESSDDAYRHPDLILDLADKLGYRDDVSAKIQVLSMLSASAIKDGAYDLASGHCEDMFKLSTRKKEGINRDVVYKGLVALGEQKDYPNIERRMTLLGQALEIAPSECIPHILTVWRNVEDGQIKLTNAAKRRRVAGIPDADVSHLTPPASSLSHLVMGEERVLGSRTAARAARLAMGFAGNTLNLRGIASNPLTPLTSSSPFTGNTPSYSIDGRRSADGDRSSFGAMFEGAGVKPGTAEAERVRHQAKKALVRGVGWLLGADQSEIEGE